MRRSRTASPDRTPAATGRFQVAGGSVGGAPPAASQSNSTLVCQVLRSGLSMIGRVRPPLWTCETVVARQRLGAQ
jgi:hypothetical protein